jgi:hypothetical protein
MPLLPIANISSSKDPSTYLALIAAAIVVETCLLINYRAFPNYWGNLINFVYTEFTLTVIIIDILALLICFSVSQQIYEFFYGHRNWSPMLFIFILMSYQIYRNVFYFYLVPKFLSKGVNQLFDVQTSINTEQIVKVVIGDIIIAIALPILTGFIKTLYISYQFDIIICGIYMICYILLNYPIPFIKTEKL